MTAEFVEAGVNIHRREISKLDDSCISNPEIRNLKLDCRGSCVLWPSPICDFGFRDLRCRNRSISKCLHATGCLKLLAARSPIGLETLSYWETCLLQHPRA